MISGFLGTDEQWAQMTPQQRLEWMSRQPGMPSSWTDPEALSKMANARGGNYWNSVLANVASGGATHIQTPHIGYANLDRLSNQPGNTVQEKLQNAAFGDVPSEYGPIPLDNTSPMVGGRPGSQISNVDRYADRIKQEQEMGMRPHPVMDVDLESPYVKEQAALRRRAMMMARYGRESGDE